MLGLREQTDSPSGLSVTPAVCVRVLSPCPYMQCMFGSEGSYPKEFTSAFVLKWPFIPRWTKGRFLQRRFGVLIGVLIGKPRLLLSLDEQGGQAAD